MKKGFYIDTFGICYFNHVTKDTVQNKLIFIKEKLWIITLISMDVKFSETTQQIVIVVEKDI